MEMVKQVEEVNRGLGALDDITIPSRIIKLPLSWDDPQTQLAAKRYQQTVWHEAPWCPSNPEFIRRINGLDSIEDVKRIVFDAKYLVLGLGDEEKARECMEEIKSSSVELIRILDDVSKVVEQLTKEGKSIFASK